METNYLPALEHFNAAREYGTVTGPLSQHLPTSNLTQSDQTLLEQTTGTTTIGDAVRSSSGAFRLMMQISSDRSSGVLTGDISKEYLQNLLSESGTSSQAFLQNALSKL